MTRKIIINKVYLETPDKRVLPNFPPLINLRLDLLETKAKVNNNSGVETILAINERDDAPAIHPAMSDINMLEHEPSQPPLFNKQYDYSTPIKLTSSSPSPIRSHSSYTPSPRVNRFSETDANLKIDDIMDVTPSTPSVPSTPRSENRYHEDHEEDDYREDRREDRREDDYQREDRREDDYQRDDQEENTYEKGINDIIDQGKNYVEGSYVKESVTPTPKKYEEAERIIEPEARAKPHVEEKIIAPKKTTEQIEKEQVTKWRWAHTLLAERWPQANLPGIDDYMDSQTLKDKYYENTRTLVLKNNIDSYREYLLMMSGAIEFGSIMLFDMKTFNGLTRFHFKNMHKYHHLLVEMGEGNSLMLGASLPPFARLLIYVLFQTLIFWLLQYAQQKGGDSKLKNMLSFFTGDSSAPVNTKPAATTEEQAQSNQEMKNRDNSKKSGKIPPPMSADAIRKLRR